MAEESEDKKPEPVITAGEIENIIRNLEDKEAEKKKQAEQKEQTAASPPPPPLPPPPEKPIQNEPTPKPVEPPRPEPLRKNSFFVTALKYFVLFIFLFAVAYFGITFYAYKNKLSYVYKTAIKNEPTKNLSSVLLPTVADTQEIDMPDTLIIPKINVNTPIIWNIEWDNAIKELKNGVVHLKGSALPGEKGFMLITGHSSYYPWDRNRYDEVFALLNNLNNQDEIMLIYQKKKYIYRVVDKKIINPNELQVLSTDEDRLDLVTCWPVGTSLRRLVVEAKLSEQSTQKPTELFLPSE